MTLVRRSCEYTSLAVDVALFRNAFLACDVINDMVMLKSRSTTFARRAFVNRRKQISFSNTCCCSRRCHGTAAIQWNRPYSNPCSTDLETVFNRLERRYYVKLSEVVGDVSLIFDNCRQYNGADSKIVRCAEIVESLFVGKIRDLRGRKRRRWRKVTSWWRNPAWVAFNWRQGLVHWSRCGQGQSRAHGVPVSWCGLGRRKPVVAAFERWLPSNDFWTSVAQWRLLNVGCLVTYFERRNPCF